MEYAQSVERIETMMIKDKRQLKSITKDEAVSYIISDKVLICTINNMSHIIRKEFGFSAEILSYLLDNGKWFMIIEDK